MAPFIWFFAESNTSALSENGSGGPDGGGMYDGAEGDSLLMLEAVDKSGPMKPDEWLKHFYQDSISNMKVRYYCSVIFITTWRKLYGIWQFFLLFPIFGLKKLDFREKKWFFA